MMKVASVINNYIHYAEEHMQKPFLNIIFPKLYGIQADEMIEQDLIDDEKFLDSSSGLIDAINEYGKTRGRYTKGTNKNPVTGTGGRTKKEPENEPEKEPEKPKTGINEGLGDWFEDRKEDIEDWIEDRREEKEERKEAAEDADELDGEEGTFLDKIQRRLTPGGTSSDQDPEEAAMMGAAGL